MREPIQLNKADEWGGTARNPHRFYSVYGKCIAVRTPTGGGNLPQILEMYEKVDFISDQPGRQRPRDNF